MLTVMIAPNVHDRAWISVLSTAIRRRRQSLRLSQEMLAELAGVSRRFVHQLEHGKASAPLDKVIDVLGVLGFELAVVDGRRGLVADPGAGGHSPIGEAESGR
jgi:HTH-type transcriptional regulator/antitoxin HipB